MFYKLKIAQIFIKKLTVFSDSRPSSVASSRPNSPALADSTQGASSSTTTRPTFTFVPSSSDTKLRSPQVIRYPFFPLLCNSIKKSIYIRYDYKEDI